MAYISNHRPDPITPGLTKMKFSYLLPTPQMFRFYQINSDNACRWHQKAFLFIEFAGDNFMLCSTLNEYLILNAAHLFLIIYFFPQKKLKVMIFDGLGDCYIHFCMAEFLKHVLTFSCLPSQNNFVSINPFKVSM